MSYGGSSGGGGRIATAADSALNNVANNDVLTYNSTVQKWINQPQSSTGSGDVYATNAQAGATYALVLSDAGKVIENTGTGALTVTVPAHTNVAFPIGTTIELLNYSSGSIIIAGDSGAVALRSAAGLRLTSQYAPAALRKRANDEWIVTGMTVV